MELLLGFMLILGGGVLVTSGVTGSSLASVVKGKPDRAKAAAAGGSPTVSELGAQPQSGSSRGTVTVTGPGTKAIATGLQGVGSPVDVRPARGGEAWVDARAATAGNPLNIGPGGNSQQHIRRRRRQRTYSPLATGPLVDALKAGNLVAFSGLIASSWDGSNHYAGTTYGATPNSPTTA